MEEQVRLARQAPGATLHQHALEAAESGIAAEFGQLVDIDVHVARDKKIDLAVAVVVGPGRSGAEASAGYACFISHLFKFAVAEVVVEGIAAESGYVNVLQTVIVVVGHGDAHAPAFATEARGLGDVGELEIGILVIERDQGIATVTVAIHGGSVHRDAVELTVIVAVNHTDASAHGLDNVTLVR